MGNHPQRSDLARGIAKYLPQKDPPDPAFPTAFAPLTGKGGPQQVIAPLRSTLFCVEGNDLQCLPVMRRSICLSFPTEVRPKRVMK